MLAMLKVTGEITPEEEKRLTEIRQAIDRTHAIEQGPSLDRLEGVVILAEQTAGRIEELRKLLANVEALRVQTEELTIADLVKWMRRGPVSGPAETVYADAIERGDWRPK